MSSPYFTRLRSIVECQNVSDKVDLARVQFDRFEDAWEGLKWLLSRKAESIGVPPNRGNPSLRLYVQDGDPISEAPEIWILFEIDAEKVDIQAINVVAVQPDDDEDLDDLT